MIKYNKSFRNKSVFNNKGPSDGGGRGGGLLSNCFSCGDGLSLFELDKNRPEEDNNPLTGVKNLPPTINTKYIINFNFKSTQLDTESTKKMSNCIILMIAFFLNYDN